MMAEAFVNEDDDPPNEEFKIKNNKQKQQGIPGPYLKTPDIEFEKLGDIADHIYYDDESENVSNYSKFNLLANLDFEFDEEEEIQLRKSSKCTKKISLFSPSIQQDENQKITMINIQNIDLLKEDYDLDDFYKFLSTLDFLSVQNQEIIDEQEQLLSSVQLFVEIRQTFENLTQLLLNLASRYQSLSFNSKICQFQQSQEQFINSINTIIDQRESNNFTTPIMAVTFFKGLQLIQLLEFLLMQKIFIDQSKKFQQAKKTIRSHWKTQYIFNKSKGCYVTLFKRDKDQRLSITSQSQAIDWNRLQMKEITLLCRNKVPNRPIFIGLDEYFSIMSKNKIQKQNNKQQIYQGIKKRNKQIHQNFQQFKEDNDYYQIKL